MKHTTRLSGATIGAVFAVFAVWTVPQALQSVSAQQAQWTGWFYCGNSGVFAYNGHYWVVYWYCDQYVINHSFVNEELVQQVWYVYVGYWAYNHTVGPWIYYYCNPITAEGWTQQCPTCPKFVTSNCGSV